MKHPEWPALVTPDLTHVTSYGGGYVNLHYYGAMPITASANLAIWTRRLPDFVRVHRTATVNPEHVQAISHNYLLMKDGSRIRMDEIGLIAIEKATKPRRKAVKV